MSSQTMPLLVDTRTSDTWLNSVYSDYCHDKSHDCERYGTFDPARLTTSAKGPFISNIESKSSASGSFYEDVINIGGQDVRNVQLALATKSNVPYGTLAIGYATNQAGASSGGAMYKTLPELMVNQRLIKVNAYSMYLNKLEANPGSILYGGIDLAKYAGDLTVLPVQLSDGKYKHFIVTVDQITYSGSKTGSRDVLLDYGYANNYLPMELAAIIWNAVKASKWNDGAPMVDCDLSQRNTETVDFEFGATRIQIPISELVYTNSERTPPLPAGSCEFGIWAQEDGSPIILGDIFLQKAYVVYDLTNNEISLAPAVTTTKTNIVELD